MGLGTAITVASIATIAVGAKAVAKRFAQQRAGYGALFLRGVEVGAAALVLCFGVLLLTGYMVSEQLVKILEGLGYPLANCNIVTLACGRWDGFTAINGAARSWRWRRWRCRSCCRSGTCISTASSRAAPHAAVAGAHKAALAQASRKLPAQNPGDDDDYCAICASIFLVSTSFVSAAAAIAGAGWFRTHRAFFQRRARRHRAAACCLPVPRSARRLTCGRCRSSALPRHFRFAPAMSVRSNAASCSLSTFRLAAPARPPADCGSILQYFRRSIMSVHIVHRVSVVAGSALVALLAIGATAAPKISLRQISRPKRQLRKRSQLNSRLQRRRRQRRRRKRSGASDQLPQITVTAPVRKPPPRQVVRSTAAADGAAGFRRPNSSPQRTTASTRRAAISTPPSAPRPTRSATTPSRRCRKAPTDGRESAAAGARRVAGFRSERLAPRPQRSRQCAIPHQRRHAARRRHRLRQRSRYRLDRQHFAGHRRAAGRIRTAHGGPDRHHDPHRHFQQFRQHQLLRRQPRDDRAELRIWRHVRRQLPRARHGTAQAVDASNCFGGVQYFFTGRYLQTTEGIENPLPTLNAIHDFSQQEKGFAYMSTFVDPWTRLSLIAGTATTSFQIPNVPGRSRSIAHQRLRRQPLSIRRSSTRTKTRTRNSACWRCSDR